MNDALYKIVLDRLTGEFPLDADAENVVLAACEGPEHLGAVLAGDEAPAAAERVPPPPVEPAGASLKAVTVEGFRGIGPKATLELTPGPGLTLVVGRNGSGKSSFAEGLEFLLTGESGRWARRSQVWREGWRNLHHPSSAMVRADLVVEGIAGVTTVTRTWTADDRLDAASAVVQPPGRPKTDLDALGWKDDLESYRPFLSYNELGSMLDEGPSKLFDALSSILGLEDLVGASETLRRARLAREDSVKKAASRLTALRAQLDAVDDERARRAAEAVAKKPWQLDALERLVVGGTGAGDQSGELSALRALCSLDAPDAARVRASVEALRAAALARDAVAGTEAERSRHLGDLLASALRFHAEHGDADCPVCGRSEALDRAWHAATEAEVVRLRAEAERAEQAHRAAAEALRGARSLLGAPAPALDRAGAVGVDASDALSAWTGWAGGRSIEDLDELAAHLERHVDGLTRAVASVVSAAQAALESRENAWRPVAAALAAWLDDARDAQRAERAIPALKKAEKWLKDAAADIRTERFAPIAEEAKRIWSMLRQQSNVELEHVGLEGAATKRRAVLDVTVDGVKGAALGVMSQGELNSLALSLFLPRAMLPESPFRFLAIDDPVQSMDPARVDGLARVLEHVAEARQVVVFTHDDRLPESVRRLGIKARVVKVTRRPGSVVSLQSSADPVSEYIDDAMALVRTEDLPPGVAAQVVPGLCRAAVEAACHEAVRRRRLGRGEPHDEVENLLLAATTVTTRAALALFDDGGRGGEVMGRINRELGSRYGDVFKALRDGAHHGYSGDLKDLVRDTERLARWLGAIR